jgi:hypothetical protein
MADRQWQLCRQLSYLLLLVDGTSDATAVPSEMHFSSSKNSTGSENKYPAIFAVVSGDQKRSAVKPNMPRRHQRLITRMA